MVSQQRRRGAAASRCPRVPRVTNMRTALAGAALIALLAGCGSRGLKPGEQILTGGAPLPSAPVESFSAPRVEVSSSSGLTAGAAAETTCEAFANFLTDITTYTPHDVARLVPDAEQVASLAHSTGQLADEADALVGYVSAPDFATNGNALGAPVQALYNDCP